MVQCCHGTGVGCCGIHEQDAAARGHVVHGKNWAALRVRSLNGQAVELAPRVKTCRATQFVKIVAEAVMGDCTVLKTVPKVVPESLAFEG